MLPHESIKKFKQGDRFWYVLREGAKVTERHWVGMYQRRNKETIYETPEIAHEHWKRAVARYEAKQPKKPATPTVITAPPVKRSKPLQAAEIARLAARWGDGQPWKPADFATVERALAKPLRLRLPASFKAFVRKVGATTGEPRLLSPREMIRDTKKLVRVPRSLRWENDDGEEVRIHTDHLVAFAADGPEARWCFCIDATGEPTVYWHHQDEPRARVRVGDGRGWLSKQAARPDFADFASWLRAQKPRRT